MITFTTTEHQTFTILTFAFEGSLETSVLTNGIDLPYVALDKGVVLSGRGPVWLFCFLTHEYHPAKWVATHDPRLGGGVVVQSHTPHVNEGDIITF